MTDGPSISLDQVDSDARRGYDPATVGSETKRIGGVRRWVALMFLGGAAVALAACGGSTVDQSDEVALIHKDLGIYNLPQAKSIDCPGDVNAKVGTTFVCHATLSNGQTVTLPSRVNTVNGSHATLGPDPAVLQQALGINVIYKSLSSQPKSVDCPSDVPAKAGKTFDCHVTAANGETGTFTLKITNASSSGQDVQVVNFQKG